MPQPAPQPTPVLTFAPLGTLSAEVLQRLRRPPNWWLDRIVFPIRFPCVIRVLIVTDGDGCHFGQGGWGLDTTLQALQHDLPPWARIEVTKAHHATSERQIPGDDPAADLFKVRLDTVGLDEFDELWLFATRRQDGADGGALTGEEIAAVWQFMQAGGGVFATGDHEDLGEALCADLPRVGTMRRWRFGNPPPTPEQPQAPAVSSGFSIRGENDTTTGVGDFDAMPQTIVPTIYSTQVGVFRVREYPHPLLCGKGGRVVVLPDHMHEGRCEVPPDLNREISSAHGQEREYPRRGGTVHPPEVVATSSINNSGLGTFGVIGAYDGHVVTEVANGVGRVAVDATWHHWFDMNTEQFATPWARVTSAVQNGQTPLTADLEPAEYWESIRDYMQNVALWLAPKARQRCLARRGLWLGLHHLDVAMTIRPEGIPLTVHDLLLLGVKARDAFNQVAPPCEQLRIIMDWIRDLRWVEVVRPWPGPPPKLQKEIDELIGPRESALIDGETLENLMLGAALAAAHRTIGDASPEQAVKAIDDGALDDAVAEAVLSGVQLLARALTAEGERLERALLWGSERLDG